MTICPFMSGPVAEGVARGGSRGCVPDLYEVECLREKCAAWGPVEPLWILEREDGETREYYVTWLKGRWRKIPKNRDHDLIVCGCRRLGFEVPPTTEPIGNSDPERDIRAIVREEIANSPRVPDADGIVAIVRGEIHRADLATRDAARRIAVGEINTAIKVARQVNVRGIE